MKRQVLESIDQVGIYPTISFVIFGLFFIIATAYVIKMSKSFVDEMKALPLDKQASNKK